MSRTMRKWKIPEVHDKKIVHMGDVKNEISAIHMSIIFP